MQIGIFAKTFAATGANEVLQAVRAAGYGVTQFNFACVGLPSMPDQIPAAIIEEIGLASEAAGVSIAAVSGTYNMIHPVAAKRERGLRQLAEIIEAAPEMGSGLVTLCTGTRDPVDQWRHHPGNNDADAWRDLTAEMAKALALAEKFGVDLGIEPELANVVASAPLARTLIDEMGSPRLKVVLDPANLFEHGPAGEIAGIIDQAVDLLGDRIAMAHAKDRRRDGSFCAAGSGVIDFRRFLARLKQSGFAGPLVTHGLSEAEAPAVARFLREVIAS